MASPFLDRLDTNYCPSEDEILEIEALIGVNTRAAGSIDEDIAQMLDSISSKIKQRDAHLDLANRHASLLAPIRKLPEDILSGIFHAYLRTEPQAPMTRTHPAVIVSHVCRAWRHLATSTPSLWSVIYLLLPHFTSRPSGGFPTHGIAEDALKEGAGRWEVVVDRLLSIAEVWVARSEGYPVEIVLGAMLRSQSLEDDTFYHGIRRCLDLLCKVSHRWRKAQFELSLGTQQASIAEALKPLSLLQAHQVPQLESLRLNTPETGVFANHSAIPMTHILRGPALRRLHIYRAPESWETLPADWTILEELHFSSTPGILGVNDMGWGTGSGSLTASQAFFLLQKCHSLVSCEIAVSLGNWLGSQSPRPHITGVASLPNLQSLTIRGPIPNAEFVRALSVPSLHTLRLSSPLLSNREGHGSGTNSFLFGPTYPEGNIDSALTWVQLLGHQLHTVNFKVASLLTTDDLKSLLECLPSVSDLSLNFWVDIYAPNGQDPRDDVGLIRLLTLPPYERGSVRDEGTSICPYLRRLNLDTKRQPGSISEEGTLEMVASRRGAPTSGGTLGEPSRLEDVIITFGTLQTMDIRQKLEERGVDMTNFSLEVSYPTPIPLMPYKLYTPIDESIHV